ncbi:MAG: DNA-3-methyladenine glycosylase 2 family protein, partial [Chitinophagia bacterium]|nr:DNA-3-methyladenine glycosylase 2 family protein [Chitinophagia bacterium]
MSDKQPYQTHLSKDPVLKPLVERITPRSLTPHANICLRLCASIMSQQLSTKVADVIYKRFLQLYGDAEPTARQILDTPHETLRAIGLSNAKVTY